MANFGTQISSIKIFFSRTHPIVPPLYSLRSKRGGTLETKFEVKNRPLAFNSIKAFASLLAESRGTKWHNYFVKKKLIFNLIGKSPSMRSAFTT